MSVLRALTGPEHQLGHAEMLTRFPPGLAGKEGAEARSVIQPAWVGNVEKPAYTGVTDALLGR